MPRDGARPDGLVKGTMPASRPSLQLRAMMRAASADSTRKPKGKPSTSQMALATAETTSSVTPAGRAAAEMNVAVSVDAHQQPSSVSLATPRSTLQQHHDKHHDRSMSAPATKASRGGMASTESADTAPASRSLSGQPSGASEAGSSSQARNQALNHRSVARRSQPAHGPHVAAGVRQRKPTLAELLGDTRREGPRPRTGPTPEERERREAERRERIAKRVQAGATLPYPRVPVTSSATGRYHPAPDKRAALHHADPFANIGYMAPHGAPDNDGKLKEAWFLPSQAFIESLREYDEHQPKGIGRYDGNAGSRHRRPIEANVRMRLGLPLHVSDWRPSQLPVDWVTPAPQAVHAADASGSARLRNTAGTSDTTRGASDPAAAMGLPVAGSPPASATPQSRLSGVPLSLDEVSDEEEAEAAGGDEGAVHSSTTATGDGSDAADALDPKATPAATPAATPVATGERAPPSMLKQRTDEVRSTFVLSAVASQAVAPAPGTAHPATRRGTHIPKVWRVAAVARRLPHEEEVAEMRRRADELYNRRSAEFVHQRAWQVTTTRPSGMGPPHSVIARREAGRQRGLMRQSAPSTRPSSASKPTIEADAGRGEDQEATEAISFEAYLEMKAMYLKMLSDGRSGKRKATVSI